MKNTVERLAARDANAKPVLDHVGAEHVIGAGKLAESD